MSSSVDLRRAIGIGVLGLSAGGFPLSQLAIRHCGVTGARISEGACAALMVRDAAMVATGTTQRLRRIPAALLWCELGAAIVATAAGLPLALGRKPPASLEAGRRAAVGTLFGLHTIRFGIYLQPNRGLRRPPTS